MYPFYRFFLFLLLVSTLFFSACDKTEHVYARHAARLNYNLVSATPPLFKAVSGSGQFCAISYSPASSSSYVYTFVGSTGETHVSPPISVTLSGIPASIEGFLVGTPQLVDLSGQYALVAFDKVCPNCYEENLIQRSLVFTPQIGQVRCPRCARTYDLNNAGIVIAGEGGRSLYRYHVSSSLTLLSIWN